MLVGLPTCQKRGAGRRADRLRITPGKKQPPVRITRNRPRGKKQLSEIRHIGKLNSRSRHVVEFRCIYSPVIENEKKDIVRTGNAVSVGGKKGPVESSHVLAPLETGIIKADFDHAGIGIITDHFCHHLTNNKRLNTLWQDRGYRELEDMGDKGSELKITQTAFIKGGQAFNSASEKISGRHCRIFGSTRRVRKILPVWHQPCDLGNPGPNLQGRRGLNRITPPFHCRPDKGDLCRSRALDRLRSRIPSRSPLEMDEHVIRHGDRRTSCGRTKIITGYVIGVNRGSIRFDIGEVGPRSARIVRRDTVTNIILIEVKVSTGIECSGPLIKLQPQVPLVSIILEIMPDRKVPGYRRAVLGHVQGSRLAGISRHPGRQGSSPGRNTLRGITPQDLQIVGAISPIPSLIT